MIAALDGRERPLSVAALVRSARAGLCAARALECSLFFGAAALLAWCAALASGAEGGAPAVAVLCGALCATTWWLEHPSPLEQVARALDARLDQGGALSLAFELEQRRPGRGTTPMEELVRRRVLGRTSRAAALRAVRPSFSLALGAFSLSVLASLLVLDSDLPGRPDAADPGALAAGLERALALGLGEDGAGEGSEEERVRREAQALRVLVAESGSITHELAPPARGTDVGERLGELDRRVAALARRAAPGSEARRRLEEARAWIDALRQGLGADAGAGGPARGGESGQGSLAGAAVDGTISRPMKAPGQAPALDPLPSTPLGLQEGHPWPPEYDEVVARWIESTRAVRAESGR